MISSGNPQSIHRIRPLVGGVLKELIWKVAIGEVKFDFVKPSLVDPHRRTGPPGISLDFVDI